MKTGDLRLNLSGTAVTKAQHNNSSNNNNCFVSFTCPLLAQTSHYLWIRLIDNDKFCISVLGKSASIMVGYYWKDEAAKANYESRSDTWNRDMKAFLTESHRKDYTLLLWKHYITISITFLCNTPGWYTLISVGVMIGTWGNSCKLILWSYKRWGKFRSCFTE